MELSGGLVWWLEQELPLLQFIYANAWALGDGAA